MAYQHGSKGIRWFCQDKVTLNQMEHNYKNYLQRCNQYHRMLIPIDSEVPEHPLLILLLVGAEMVLL